MRASENSPAIREHLILNRLRTRLETQYLETCGFASGKQFTDRFVASAKPNTVTLDAGCGEAELRNLLPEGAIYVGIDRTLGVAAEYPGWQHGPSLAADLHDIPLADAVADTVVSLHVLEHVERPDRVLDEFCRVMKDGAKLYLAVPFIHEIHHAPFDYHRFTRHGLELLLRRAGLQTLEISPTGGYYRCLDHVLAQQKPVLHGQPWWRRALTLPIATLAGALRRVVKVLEYPLDLLDAEQRLVCGYVCVAEKLPNGPSA